MAAAYQAYWGHSKIIGETIATAGTSGATRALVLPEGRKHDVTLTMRDGSGSVNVKTCPLAVLVDSGVTAAYTSAQVIGAFTSNNSNFDINGGHIVFCEASAVTSAMTIDIQRSILEAFKGSE